MRRSYSLSSYDDQFRLKPPFLLWIAILYLSRSITLPLLLGLGSFVGVASEGLVVLRGLWSIQALVPSIVAAVVPIALWWRSPSTPAPVRWIGAHGHILLAVAAGIDLALTLILPAWRGDLNDANPLPLLAAAFDLYFLIYVLAAPRVRDTFAELSSPAD